MTTIVVLGSYAPSLIHFRGNLIRALVQRGYRVVAMAPAITADLADRLRAMGAEPRDVPIENQSLNPWTMVRSIGALTRAFREVRPDNIIAYTIKPVTLGAIAAARAKVPRFVALITGLGYAFSGGATVKRRLAEHVAASLYRSALRRSSAIIFQNSDDQAFFRTRNILPMKPVSVVVPGGSGIDLNEFRPVALPEETRFLMISRLLGDKGVREYGKAAMQLKAEHPQAHFSLVGYLDDSPDAISRQEMSAIEAGGVEFLGRMDDVRPAIARSSVYVLPSYREGTPRSVLEAMAMGRPIVTTDAPGCRETVVDGQNGFLAAPRDAGSLAEAMKRFILDPEIITAMGARSRRMAEERFDVEKINAQLIAAAGL